MRSRSISTSVPHSAQLAISLSRETSFASPSLQIDASTLAALECVAGRWPTHKPTHPPKSGVPIHDAPFASWVGKHNPRPAGCCSSVRNCRRVPSTNSVPKPRIIPAQGNRGSQRQVFVAGVDHHPRSASAKYPEGRKPALFLVRSPNPIPWSLFPGPLAHPPAQSESAASSR